MKLNEIYAVRQGADGQLYGATDYKAKPNHSNECIKTNAGRILTDTKEKVKCAYTRAGIKATIVFIIGIIIGYIFMSNIM